MGGGKGGSSAPSMPPVKDYSNELMQMQNMLFQNTQRLADMKAAIPPTFTAPALPAVETVAPIDWTAIDAASKDKATAAFDASNAVKKGRSDTILTNPLLDSTDPSTTDTLLS